jgi:amidohydrolase
VILPAVRDELADRGDALVALRRDLHRHPELSFAEHRTTTLIGERLQRAGLAVSRVAGGVVAVLEGDRPGRTIAWRADMDALPIDEQVDSEFRSRVAGAMHACGHDGHTAIAVVLAEALAAQRRSLPGRVVFVFQPAEETLSGAQPMLDAGVLEHNAIDEIYGLHLTSRLAAGRIEACPGISMASADFLEVDVRGRGGHGASPHMATNPLDVAARILVGLGDVVRRVLPAAGTGSLAFTQIAAGVAPNIIPEIARMQGSLRALRSADRKELLDALAAHVERIAAETGARAFIHPIGACCPALVNDENLAAHVRSCAGALGDVTPDTGEPVLASDDMSLFLQRRPGCYFRVGAAPSAKPPQHHSPDFAIDEAGLAVGARVASAVIVGRL